MAKLAPEEVVHAHAQQIENQAEVIPEVKGLKHRDAATAQTDIQSVACDQ